MRSILGDSRRVSGQNVALQEWRIYWPHSRHRAKRLGFNVESVLSVRSGIKGNGKLLGLILQTPSQVVAMTCDGKQYAALGTVGKAVNQLLEWKGLA